MINGEERALLKMVRFCDKEVYCATEEALDRQQLISYFLNGNRDEIICIFDTDGRFVGNITYDSLLGRDLDDAVLKDYIVMDENVWENGRKYFRSCKKEFGGTALLPVINKERQLLCFAWQDYEANRELRMLDELLECQNALDFKEVYPKYDGVTIYGCNELAYYFAKYLDKIGVLVNVVGEIWDKVSNFKKIDILDYKTLTVLAEGEGDEESVDQRDSVSVEFECIDRIYERNICKGIIEDKDGKFKEVVGRLKGRHIALLGTKENSLNAYDLLLKYGIDISCFVSDSLEEQGTMIFGKKVQSRLEVMENYKNVIFIEPNGKYSAWGFGGVDLYHYFGYKRNVDYFLLKDYIDIPEHGLLTILNFGIKQIGTNVVLIGDFQLSVKLCQVLEEKNPDMQGRIMYCNILKSQVKEIKSMACICEKDISEKDICLLLLPQWYGCVDHTEIISNRQKIKEKYLLKLKASGLTNIIDYNTESTIFMDNNNGLKTEETHFKVGKIILGAINYHSGNCFFRQLLDNHPDILMFYRYTYLNENLFSICVRLSVEKSADILTLFWKLCSEGNENGFDKECTDQQKLMFDQSMKKMLDLKETYTSQELFVMIHVAYAKMWDKDVKDISHMVIYWEPHNVPRSICEEYAIWLNKAAASGYIVNMVRNAYIRSGSGLNRLKNKGILFEARTRIVRLVFDYPNNDEKNYFKWKRVILKFEEIKCHPLKELESLCDELGISWSDSLLETTTNGKKAKYGSVTGYDMIPVYNTYEKYLSTFDRFRISLILGPWQKRYGYPYVCSLDFSRRELRDMFRKEFKFEQEYIFKNDDDRMKFKKWVYAFLNYRLWITRRMEVMEDNEMGF